jgi:hypothetical protein
MVIITMIVLVESLNSNHLFQCCRPSTRHGILSIALFPPNKMEISSPASQLTAQLLDHQALTLFVPLSRVVTEEVAVC